MKQQKPFSEADLLAAIRTDCLRQAQVAQTKLNEVLECLGDESHLGALGAFAGLDDDLVCLKIFLTRIATFTVGPIPNRTEQPAPLAVQKGERRSRATNPKTRNSI